MDIVRRHDGGETKVKASYRASQTARDNRAAARAAMEVQRLERVSREDVRVVREPEVNYESEEANHSAVTQVRVHTAANTDVEEERFVSEIGTSLDLSGAASDTSSPIGVSHEPRDAMHHAEETFFNLSPVTGLSQQLEKVRVTVDPRPGHATVHDTEEEVVVRPLRSIIGSVFVVGFVASLLIFTQLSVANVFFWSLFACLVIWRIDSRWAVGGALVCLVGIPILLVVGRDLWAEQVAVWVYSLLAIGVTAQILERFGGMGDQASGTEE